MEKQLNYDEHGKMTLWDELSAIDASKLRVLPWGAASIPPPDFFKDSINKAVQEMSVAEYQYTPACGTKNLRKVIVESFSGIARYRNADPDRNVIVASGAIVVTEFALRALINDSDDQVLCFEPYYPWHFMYLKYKGKIVFSKLKADAESMEFKIDYDDFRSKLNKNTKVVIFTNPNNPTAKVFSEEEYTKLTEILNEFPHVTIIEDSAYCVYLEKDSKLRYFHEFGNNITKTLTVFSGGKIFNTTGIRVGWGFGCEELISLIRDGYSDNPPPSCLEQKVFEFALPLALQPYQKCDNYWEFTKKDLELRVVYILNNINPIYLHNMNYQGTYYAAILIDTVTQQIEDKYYYRLDKPDVREPYRDKAFARKLIAEFKVGVLPLSALHNSNPKEDRFVRIAFNRNWEELVILMIALQSFAWQQYLD